MQILSRMSSINFSVTPIAKIKYWRNLVSSNIQLGEDVYFECEIRANPATYNVTWRHNVSLNNLPYIPASIHSNFNQVFIQGKRVDENVTNGVIIGNQTLVLQAVQLSARGLYTCVASNLVADGESNAALLDIKCECRKDQTSTLIS